MKGMDCTQVSVALEGHLSESSLRVALGRARAKMGMYDAVDLVVDCMLMHGYDVAARAHFVEWMREHRPRIRRVAVVTDRKLWHMVIRAMAFASGQQMTALSDRSELSGWLSSADAAE
ncbi:MAG: STAS/SEC14 domain-containing protein [Myxococcales bacterium]|nr:STAS/SEC14 domain-containing protein [Myxococcales bacterium]